MTAVGWLPGPTEELFGTEATAEESYELLTVDVPPATWLAALRTARDDLGCTYFDWLSAVDEPGTGFRVSAHVVALSPVRGLLVRTTVPHETPVLPTAVDIYAGAAWHERETHEMFGVDFEGHPALDHLLLPETFEGHPLRKDFVLAARVAKAWPGAKEPGESDHGGPKRRQMLPPGVPDPNEWGPLKGQLPPAPARPARGAARAAGDRPVRAEGGAGDRPVRGAGAPGDRPARRARTASEGSASQTAPGGREVPQAGKAAGVPSTESQAQVAEGAPAAPSARPRRARSASEGSASQIREPGAGTEAGAGAEAGAGTGAVAGTGAEAGARARGEAGVGEQPPGTPATPRRARSASEGSASQQTTGTTTPRRSRSAGDGSASQQGPVQAPAPAPAAEPESTPAAEPSQEPAPASAREGSTSQPPTAPRSTDAPWHNARPAFDEPGAEREPEPEAGAEREPESEAEPKPSPAKRPAAGPSAEADSPPTPDDPTPQDPTPDTPAGGPQ